MLHLRSIRGCGTKLQAAPPLKLYNKQFVQQRSTFSKSSFLSQQTKTNWSSQLLVSSKLNTLNTINAFRNQTVVSRLNFIKPNVWQQQSRNFWNFSFRDTEGSAAARMRKIWTRRATDPEYEHSYYDYKKRQWVKVGLGDYKSWLRYRPKQMLLLFLLLLFGLSVLVEMDLFNQNKDVDYYIRVFQALFKEPIESLTHMWYSFLNVLLRYMMWMAPFKFGMWSGFWRNLVVGEEDWIPFETMIEPYLPMPYGPQFFLVLDPLIFINAKFHPIRGWSVMKRPGTDFFLETVAQNWEITMYTDDYSLAQDSVTNRLDPEWNFVSNAIHIDSCVRRQGEYYKDVTLLKRPLDRLLLLDGKKRSCDFERNTENCLQIPYWDGDPNDTVLLDLLPFLMDISDEAPDEDVDIRRIVESVKGIDIATYYKPLRLLAKEATDEQVARRRQEDSVVDNILKQFIIDFMQTRKEDAALDPFMYVDETPEDAVREALPHLAPEWQKIHPEPVFQDRSKNDLLHEKMSYRPTLDPLSDALPGKSIERRVRHLEMVTGLAEDDKVSPDPITAEEEMEGRARADYFRSRYNRIRQKYTPNSAPSPYGDFMLDEDEPIPPAPKVGWSEDVDEQIRREIEQDQEKKKSAPKGKRPAPRSTQGVSRERAKRLSKKSEEEEEEDE